jgi:hypothetical protein
MPQKSWAVGEEVLAVDFNTYAQNQVVPQFTTTAQRDTQWPTPPNSAFCVTQDTGTLWQRSGTAWVTPFKRLAYITRTTAVSPVTAETIALTLPNVVVASGRAVRVAGGWYNVGVGTGNEGMIARIRSGTTTAGAQLQATVVTIAASGSMTGVGPGGMLEISYTPTAGGNQWILTFAPTGTANTPVNGGPGQPIWLGAWDDGSSL